jgi:hypothetical protein
MAKELFDRKQVDPGLGQAGRKGVPQVVEVETVDSRLSAPLR